MPKIQGIDIPKADNTKNYIQNGDMYIAQRTTTVGSAPDATFVADRFAYRKSGAMVHTVQISGSAPTQAESGYNFQNSLLISLTTPDTSIAAGDYCMVQHGIEGTFFKPLSRKYMTLSFWVRAAVTGIRCVSLRNSGSDRSYVAEYTINQADTWEKKTIVIPPSPEAGSWNYANGVGLRIAFILAAGTTYHTTAGAWQTGNFLATANQINGTNTGAGEFRITGVMLNEGVVAAPFRLFSEDESAELLACMRYCEFYSMGSSNDSPVAGGNWTFFANTNAFTTSSIYPYVLYKVRKRTNAPTGTLYDGVGNAGKFTTISTGGAATNNLTPGDIIFKGDYMGIQAGAVGAHAGVSLAYKVEDDIS